MRDVHIIVTEKDDKLMFHFPRDVVAFKECEDLKVHNLDMTAYSDEFKHEDTIGMVDAEIKMFKNEGYLKLHFPENILFPKESLYNGVTGVLYIRERLLEHKIIIVPYSPEF